MVPGALCGEARGPGDEAGEALRGAAPARGGRVGEVRVRLVLLRGGAPWRTLVSSGAGAGGGLVPAGARHPRSLPGARGAARRGGEHGDGAEAAEARGGDLRAPSPRSGAPEVAGRRPRAQQSPGCCRSAGVRQGPPSSKLCRSRGRQVCKERCEELTTRAAAAESAVAAAACKRSSGSCRLQHCKCQERCEELANRLEAAEAEASEHAKTKERLAHAEADACEQRLELQRLQKENLRFKDGCQRAETGGSTELQVEKAVWQDRCEQLQQQLTEARGQLEVLWQERGMYQERLCQLAERKKQEFHHHRHPTFNHRGPAPSNAAFGDQESDLAEQLGYSLVDEDHASILSGSSGCSVKQNCFMLDAIFKSRMDVFREGSDLQKGSQVLAGDGETVLEVVEISKEARTTEVVDLQAGAATLRVTPDHPVQVPDEGGKAGRHLYMPAGKLKVGDFVMLGSGEPVALTIAETLPMECKVLKIVFNPNLPVAVFSSPSCILSKGHKKSQNRRSIRGRGKEAAHPVDEGASIPDTAAGEYTD